MGYEVRLQAQVLELLRLFQGRTPDVETNAWTIELASDFEKWLGAHGLFRRIRQRSLDAIRINDRVRAH